MKNTILRDISSNAKEAHNTNLNSTELIKKEEVENTPFTIVTTENEIFAVMGEYRVTEKYDKNEYGVGQLKAMVQEITWNRLVQVIMIINEKLK